MDNQFSEVMHGLTDEQLVNVVVNRIDYVPDALRAAENVLRTRGFSDTEMEATVAEGKAMESIALAKAELPLETHHKILYFLLSFLSATPFVAIFYRYHAERGHDRRAAESQQAVMLGILFYAALFGIIQNWVLGNW